MKHKIIYTLLFSLFFMGGMNAQLDCTEFFDVDLNENGEAQIQASDLIEDVEFFIANGTLTYLVFPYSSGVINSGSDIIQLNCTNAGVQQYIIEYTVDGALEDVCLGTINVFDPTDSCPNSSAFCGDSDDDCSTTLSWSFLYTPENPMMAVSFARCNNYFDCDGDYQIAKGSVSNATNLTYDDFLNFDDIDDYITPLVLSYTENGGTQFKQTSIYIWENLECLIVPKPSVTIELDLTAEVTVGAEVFLDIINPCEGVKFAVTEINGDLPTDFFDNVTLNCDDLGYHTVYLKDEETGIIVTSQLFLSDPLETCGPILGPGDKLIKMYNDPPLGTYTNTKISVNGVNLLTSPAGKGWIVNENMLIDGTNTLEFDSGPFSLNGISTLDIVRLQRIIIYDEYNTPMESIVMDVDNSGYNGIGDLILTRKIILGQSISQDVTNVVFKPQELQFPVDFSPFDFDYDFTKYVFEKGDFDNLSFLFEAYKVGDFSGNAILEDGLKNNLVSTTRDFNVFEVSDLEITAGEPFTFSLIYDNGMPIKGLLAALVSNGIKFESLISQYGGEVQYNIIEDNEIRISYLSPNPNETIEKIFFHISAVSDNSGNLIDFLGLKAGFPQEVINGDDEVIIIEELEESGITATSDIDFSAEISIYPNPTSQKLLISTQEGSIGQVEILDPMGKRVILQKSNNAEMYIDVSNLANGLYYISIENNKNIINKSFIKI